MLDFDRLVDEAWPAPNAEDLGGWRLRFARGVTKRANSVWPAGEQADVGAAIDAAERRYSARGLPTVFSVSANARPEGLDDLLAARGYEVVDPTVMMTLELSEERPVSSEVRLADAPSPEWLDLWWSVDGRFGSRLDTAESILTGVPAGYALAGDGADDGVGRGVRQGDWLGIYCMAVAPRARRRGLGRDVLHALLNHGLEQGARRAYLSVTAHNTAARALYEQAGFEIAGGYHYRVRRT